MIADTPQAMVLIHAVLTKLPISLELLVKRTSGTTAKGSWRLRMTWLKINSVVAAAEVGLAHFL